jgi:cytochrome c oxidase assembly protein subunit 11
VDVKRTVLKLVAGTAAMFAFAFALVPLYDVLCEVTGLNGKTGDAYEYVEADLEADRSRLVQIRFVTNGNGGMPWEFGPNTGGMRVHPGGVNEATFHARNTTGRIMVAQAIPSVAPGRAAAFFHKTQCFCFDQQVLEPGEAIDMPVRFIVDRDLPRSVGTITLSYTMFDITQDAAGQQALAEYRASGTRRIPGTGPGDAIGGPSAGN